MRILILIILCGFTNVLIAQEDEVPDSLLGWTTTGNIGTSFSQVHLSNWVAGGQSSFALLTNGNIQLLYRSKKVKWESNAGAAYGLLRPMESTWYKTDDRVEISTQFGRRAFKGFMYTLSTSLKTQFAPGYNYPNDSTKISEFMAPGYWIISLGLEFVPIKGITIMASPLTAKTTFVLDHDLANAGAYGVDPAIYAADGTLLQAGAQHRKELGAYVKMTIQRKIAENITLKTNLDLFSNYLDRPENIDINWENLLLMKVNKYITVNIGTHLIYDHDIDIEVDENNDGTVDKVGPRTQFKELLSVGMMYQF